MKTIAEKQQELIALLNDLNDPLMQYEFLLELSGEMPVPDPSEKNAGTRIRNCQTDSWLIMREENQKLRLQVDSDALLIRGVLCLYAWLLDGEPLEEIVQTPLTFMENDSVKGQLSKDRFSVLADVEKDIRLFCQSFLSADQ